MPFFTFIGGGVPFAPESLFAASEVGVWYDPSDFSTMFQDAAGTTPVTAAGDPVGYIADKSGNAKHATQSTSASRPTLQQTAGGLWYLDFDGIDDSLATSSIDFTGTDKMTVFAGVTRDTDATAGMLLELSATVASNAGSFYLTAPENTTVRYASLARGSAAVTAGHRADITSGTAPDTAVVTATHDIAGDLSKIRRNGVAGTDGTTDKGTGNFGNYPLYLGRRAGSTIPFNGRLFSLIVRGAATDSSTINSAESWVNAKTGAY